MKLLHWQHACVSLAITFLMLILIWILLATPLESYYQSRIEVLKETQLRLEKLKKLAIQNVSSKEKIKKEKERSPEKNYFISASSVSLAAARMQDKVKSLVTNSKGELISTQVLPGKKEDYLTPVIIRVHLRTDISGLQSTLYELESARPLSYIGDMRVQYRSSGRKRKSDSVEEIMLDVQFTLASYMLNKMGNTNAK